MIASIVKGGGGGGNISANCRPSTSSPSLTWSTISFSLSLSLSLSPLPPSLSLYPLSNDVIFLLFCCLDGYLQRVLDPKWSLWPVQTGSIRSFACTACLNCFLSFGNSEIQNDSDQSWCLPFPWLSFPPRADAHHVRIDVCRCSPQPLSLPPSLPSPGSSLSLPDCHQQVRYFGHFTDGCLGCSSDWQLFPSPSITKRHVSGPYPRGFGEGRGLEEPPSSGHKGPLNRTENIYLDCLHHFCEHALQ